MTTSVTLERRLEIDPAYDKRDPDPKKNYGVHGVTMRWYVIGPLGAIQFILYTNWQLPGVMDEFDKSLLARGIDEVDLRVRRPLPADIGYHSPVPMYEGHTPMGGTCPILKTTCYYDGSSHHAERYFDILVQAGGEALWSALETCYHERFESGDDK